MKLLAPVRAVHTLIIFLSDTEKYQSKWDEFVLPVGQGFDHFVPAGLTLPLYVQSKAQEEPLQMHKRHFVSSVSLAVMKRERLILRSDLLRKFNQAKIYVWDRRLLCNNTYFVKGIESN
ncbi:unnamed protein product [Dovyalis caffra]|uniref:Uncharacterized protein n=1 Tax=Dovyalis caffra TaxID=77055 RepID=A0AAV1SC95_9ROSI|nr:unnamed protein product [Dovyalis caffra]